MAPDRLNQLGKTLREQRKEIDFVTKNVAKNLPVIELSEDLLGVLYTYRLEFKTYTNSPIVKLSVTFKPRFRIFSTRDRALDG